MDSVSLKAFDEADIPALMALSLAPEQHAFVRPVAEILAAKTASQTAYVITLQRRVVGFFIIDADYPYSDQLSLVNAGVLRSFFVAQQYQGCGYAKQALALLPDLLRRQTDLDYLALTVNCLNTAAQYLYLNAGLEDSKVLYLAGPAGPQHIYWCQLR